MDKLQISNMLSFVAKKYENIISTFEDKWKRPTSVLQLVYIRKKYVKKILSELGQLTPLHE